MKLVRAILPAGRLEEVLAAPCFDGVHQVLVARVRKAVPPGGPVGEVDLQDVLRMEVQAEDELAARVTDCLRPLAEDIVVLDIERALEVTEGEPGNGGC